MDKTLGNKTTGKLKKTRKRRYYEAMKEMPTPKEQTDSIITKHRITRNVGIYNKAKRSDTILRENNQPNIMKKDCTDIEQQMKKDLSKVLDVSSFRINNLGISAGSPNHKHLPSDVDTYLPTERNSLNSPRESVASSLCGSAGDLNRSYSSAKSKGLAYKTPLQEISENLMESLHPANTFHGRNYFSEVKEQILKVFKHSSANQRIEKHEIHSAFHKRLNKRKTGEPALKPLSPNHFSLKTSFTVGPPKMSKIVTPEDTKQHIPVEGYIRCQSWDKEYIKQCEPKMANNMENPSSKVEVSKIHDTTNQMMNQTCDRKENLLCKNVELFPSSRGKQIQDGTYIRSTSTFDILDFLDHTILQENTNPSMKHLIAEQNDKELEYLVSPLSKSQMKTATVPVDRKPVLCDTINKTTENPKFFPHQKEEDIELFQKSFPEVSPLRKPSLKTPTPPRFYRRKMF